MRKILLSIGAALGVAAVVIVWPRPVILLLKTCFKRVVWEFEPAGAWIALTFDDGPDPVYTPQVLRILRRFRIQATFFLVGERARQYPDMVAAIREAGHDVGSHGDSWRRTVSLGGDAFERDLLEAERSLGLAKGAPKYFRPAGGMMTPDQFRRAERLGYRCVLGSSYAFDPYRPPARLIAFMIQRSMRPGAIIVLHDSGGNRSSTVEALPRIITAAQQKGLSFRPLSGMAPR